MTSISGYSIASYGDMMISEPRMSRYVDALRRAVTPGCRVIDLGCGPGIFAFLALQFGAAHVDAIEPDPSILIARQIANANGLSDRITFFQGLSTAFIPAAPADVLVSDIRGAMPLFQHHVPTIVDARQRLLRPGGVQIPQCDTIRVALLSDPELTRRLHSPWDDRWGLDLSAARPFGVNEMIRQNLTADKLVSEAADIITVDYTTVTDPQARGTAALTPHDAVTVDGIAIWFDARLDSENGYSNAPDQPQLVYGQSVLPLVRPLTLAKGDVMHLDLRATLVDGGYQWTWITALQAHGSTARTPLHRQSTLQGNVIDPAVLIRRADGHVPQPGSSHRADLFILQQVDGIRTQGAIAAELRGRFPDLGLDAKAALKRVADVLGRDVLTGDRP